MDSQFKPVVDAAYAGDLDLFRSLLEKNPELITGTSSDRGDSPNLIQFVVVEGGLGKIPNAADFLMFLIDNGSTTHRQLIAAASVNSRELVDVLLDAGVDLDEGAPWTALEEALYWGHREMGEYLLSDHGATLQTLCAAAMIGDLEKLESFFNDGRLSASALPVYFPWGPFEDSTEKDAIEQAFILALRNKQYEVASFLLDSGVDVNSITPCYHQECTALHLAVDMNDIEMVDWLIDRGATGGIKDKRFNDDVMGWAMYKGHSEVEAHLKTRLSSQL